jgi:flagellar biosynthesis protein FlhG
MFASRPRLPQQKPPRAPQAQLIAVASGKGGVGKTWLSSTLSASFAERGLRTLLFDGDFGLANVDLQLGINPQADLSAVVAGWVELADAIHPVNGGSSQQGGFDVLAGCSGKGTLSDLHYDEVARLAAGLVSLSALYDRVIVDIAAGIDLNVMKLVMACDRVLVVTNDEPPTMADAYAFLKVLKGHRADLLPSLVINLAEKRSTARRTYDALAKASEVYLGYRPALAGVITRDSNVPETIRAQKPLAQKFPQSIALEDVRRLAEALGGI